MGTPTLTRPQKVGNVTTYVAEVNYLAPADAPILAPEVDADLDTLYNAWNNPASAFPPSGAAGGDLAGTYPNPTVRAGLMPTTLPPSGPAGGDLAGSYPNPIVRAGLIPTTLPPSGAAGGDLAGTYPNPTIKAGVIPSSLPPSGAAGGDLQGTYPNPTINPTKLPWTVSGAALTPTDTTKVVTLPGNTAFATGDALAWGARTLKSRLVANTPSGGADALRLTINRVSAATATADDNTQSTWELNLRTGASNGGDFRLLFSAAGTPGTQTTPLTVIGSSGDLLISGSNATKASGAAWINPSDSRLKDNVRPYISGLTAVLALNPMTFTYNGKGGSPAGLSAIGLIADDVRPVMPEMVTTRRGKLLPADVDEVDILQLDTTALPLALVNAVKELAARVTALETAAA